MELAKGQRWIARANCVYCGKWYTLRGGKYPEHSGAREGKAYRCQGSGRYAPFGATKTYSAPNHD